MEKVREQNRDVFLNLGLIAYGSLRDIEALQEHIEKECKPLKIVYMTVTGQRLYLKKKLERGEMDERKERARGHQ